MSRMQRIENDKANLIFDNDVLSDFIFRTQEKVERILNRKPTTKPADSVKRRCQSAISIYRCNFQDFNLQQKYYLFIIGGKVNTYVKFHLSKR